MKKLSEKYHLEYFLLFVLLCGLEIVLLAYAVLHPRPQNIMLALMDGFLIFLNGRWMNKAKYVSPREYEKEVNDWKKRKREAKKHGERFGEPRPERPKKMAERLLPMLIAVVFFGYFLYFFASLLNLGFPAHMPYEYKSDIEKLKEVDMEAYYFFPDAIPKEAKNVKWVMLPSFLQGNGTEVLIFDAPNEYIQEVVDAYGVDAQIGSYEDGMDFRMFYDKARLEKLTVYKIYDNKDWNHLHMWGFFVDEEIDRIGFFCQ